MRWPRLLLFVVLVVMVPLVVALVAGIDLTPLAIAWALIFLVGAGGAGLRAYGTAYQTPEQDWEQRRDTKGQFERPRDEGRLL